MSYERMNRRREYWLCADGTLIQEPHVESTPAGRRVKIEGHSESVSRNDLSNILYQWAYRRARTRDTVPVQLLRYHPGLADEGEWGQVIATQVGRLSRNEHFPPFESNARGGVAQWLFQHPTLPIHGLLQLTVTFSYKNRVDVEVTFPNLRPGDEKSRSGNTYRRPIATAEPAHMGEEAATAYRSILAANGVTLGERDYPNAKAAMADAVRRYREIDALEALDIPDLRYLSQVPGGAPMGHIGAMKLQLAEAMQPESYLHEMQEYAHMLDPADEIESHWRSIIKLLERQGVMVKPIATTAILDVLTGSEEALKADLRALRMKDGAADEDKDHGITLDLLNGIVFVECSNRQSHKEQDVLAYEIAKARAEITGETDLLDAFLASIGRSRAALERMDLIDAARSDA